MKTLVPRSFLPFVFLLTALPAATRAQHVMDSNGLSRQTLEYYLSRAVTMAEFLAADPFGNDGPYPYKADDVRLIQNIGAKFIGRAIYRWGNERVLNNPAFLEQARRLMQQVHARDPEVIFQAAVFEAVSEKVNEVPIPAWAFEALELPVERRNFRYADMLNLNGKFVDHWGRWGSVPDITRQEAQLWLMYLCGTYMNLGCEALHMGQIALMGMEDKGLRKWAEFMAHVRAYAKKHTRRHWVLLDAHTPAGGMVVDGKSLLDFNSFPLRIKPVTGKPMEGMLQVGHVDAIYGRSKACVTPSGWQCDALPYLVEFDNFGISKTPGVADTASHFIWGYDEITWLYLQPEAYRGKWLKYAYNWLAAHDASAFLQMPVSRIISRGRGFHGERFRGNINSAACPQGNNMELVIKEIWKE
ncbi:hypothetical protein [Chitinophaga sp.]|uniref:hypothetical protein n=1 Tax=Chitinophaga sp. TaxID=1869181 RepID=UPI0031D1404E